MTLDVIKLKNHYFSVKAGVALTQSFFTLSNITVYSRLINLFFKI